LPLGQAAGPLASLVLLGQGRGLPLILSLMSKTRAGFWGLSGVGGAVYGPGLQGYTVIFLRNISNPQFGPRGQATGRLGTESFLLFPCISDAKRDGRQGANNWFESFFLTCDHRISLSKSVLVCLFIYPLFLYPLIHPSRAICLFSLSSYLSIIGWSMLQSQK
jgi:hypothetical protein